VRARRLSLLLAWVICGAATASAAFADGIARVSPSVARPGEHVMVLADGLFGPRPQPVAIPVYLVPAGKLPRPLRCQGDALCQPRVLQTPRRWPYTRVATLRRYNGGRLTFRVPSIMSGRYGFVFYCDVCWNGRGGTLIANVRGPKLRIQR
jgi:hypothetical protein